MQIGELRNRPGSGTLPNPPTPLRVEEVLPADGYTIGPPQAEDRVEISPLACALLRASERLDLQDADKVEWIRNAYMRGEWPLDEEGLAAMFLANPVLARAMGYQPKPEEQPNAALSLSTRRMAQKRANAVADDLIGYQVAVRGSPQVFHPSAEMGNKAASATWFDV